MQKADILKYARTQEMQHACMNPSWKQAPPDQSWIRIKKKLKNATEKKKKNSGEHQIHVDIKAKLNKQGSDGRRMDNNQHDLYKEIILAKNIINKKMIGGEKELEERSMTVLVSCFLVSHQLVVSKNKIWCFWKHSNSNS